MTVSKKVVEQEVVLPTIHAKYQKYIDMAMDGYVVGFTHGMAMEVLRFCESKRNCQLGLNSGCAQCLIGLLKMLNVTGR